MKRSDFSYHLPPDLIAQEPRQRGRSRMMVVTPPDAIEHDNFANFPARLTSDDVVVINDTRVIPARLFARPLRGMSRPIEVLLVKRVIPSVNDATSATHPHSSFAHARSDRPDQQHFDRPLHCPFRLREQPRRDHSRVIDDQRVFPIESLREMYKIIVNNFIQRRDYHHARSSAFARLLRDQLGRQFVGKVAA